MSKGEVQHILVFARTVRDIIKETCKSQSIYFSDTGIFDVDKIEQEFKEHMKKVSSSLSGAKTPAIVLAINANSLTEGVVDGKDGSFSAYYSAIYNAKVENNTFIYLYNYAKPNENTASVDVVKKYESLKEYNSANRLFTTAEKFDGDKLVAFIDSENQKFRIKPKMTYIYEITKVKQPSYFMQTVYILVTIVAIVFSVMYLQKSSAVDELRHVRSKIAELTARIPIAAEYRFCVPYLRDVTKFNADNVPISRCQTQDIVKLESYSGDSEIGNESIFNNVRRKIDDEIKNFSKVLQTITKSKYSIVAKAAEEEMKKLEAIKQEVEAKLQLFNSH